MQISPITQFTPIHNIANKKQHNNKNTQNPIMQNTTTRPIFAYQDFNISFSGRTPENFYAQDFNRNNMPSSMKEYLDYDYETRQHIPPEQMMGEVFKYLKMAKNFSDVKSIYPNEELFQNLHSNKTKGKTSLLAEIKVAKEMDDAPLLKDGNDDFGMYLLRKIYVEGKTLKEINKDFYEKDMNEEYKGVITKPLSNDDTAAYGIRFPKQSFWNSFIATRDEYKKFFVTLPKNSNNPAVHLPYETHSNNIPSDGNKTDRANESNKPRKKAPRKYKIQDYQKKQLANDIKSSDMSKTEVEKKVRKRFGKDDPQASFIVKYLSPIMTVAADKIHLSEEMKYFNQNNPQNKNDNRTLFERFWKANPYILEQYAKTITDSIEMFEEVYESGGLIPINTDLEVVTPQSKNKKIIDQVNPDFLDLLNYTQNIEPTRTEKYKKHEELQKQWEEHFVERYGELNDTSENTDIAENPVTDEEVDISKLSEDEQENLLYKIAKENNGDVFKLKGKNGQNIYITGKLDEGLAEYLKEITKYLPTAFTRQFTNYVMNNPEVDDRFKLAIATRGFRDKLDDERVMSDEEFEDATLSLPLSYIMSHKNSERAASAAISDVLCNTLDDMPISVHKLRVFEFYDLLESVKNEKENAQIPAILLSHKKEIDALYAKYNKQLTDAERNKISIAITEGLSKYSSEKSGNNIDPNYKAIMLMLKASINNSKFSKKIFKSYITSYLSTNSACISLLNKKLSDEHKQARLENIMSDLFEELLFKRVPAQRGFYETPLLTVINRENYDKYKYMLDPEIRASIEENIELLSPDIRNRFNMTNEEQKECDKYLAGKKI